MYTEQDEAVITGRIRKYWIMLAIGAAIPLAVFVFAITKRIEPLAMAAAAALFIYALFMILEFIVPCVNYRRFLRGIHNGLSREIAGTVVEISDKEELQDGVRVLPVRVFMPKEDDEHIVYLNADKRDMMPGPGADVRLNCQGRHILGLMPLTEDA